MAHDKSRAPPTLAHPGMSESLSGNLTGLYLRLKHLFTQPPFPLFPPAGASNEHVNTLLISLPISGDRRRDLFSKLNRESWRLSSVKACYPPDPGSLDSGEWKRFHAMSKRLVTGQRGCFLSHRRAWLKALDDCADLTLILEDDVIPLYEKLPLLPTLPEDLDVLYLHHFAQHIPTLRQLLLHFLMVPIECLGSPFKIYNIDEILSSHCGRLHRAAMPGCAYGITSSGATKLLSIFDELGNFFQWDSIMLRHAISTPVFSKMLPYICSDAYSFYRGQHPHGGSLKMSSTRLNAYAIYPPLVIHNYNAPSVKFAIPDRNA